MEPCPIQSGDQKFNGTLYLDRSRQRAWRNGTLLLLGFNSAVNRRNISLGYVRRQRRRLIHHRVFCHFHWTRWKGIREFDSPTIRHDWILRRLHDVFVIQPADAQPDERRRMVSGRREYRGVCGLLHDGSVGRISGRR